MSNQATINGKVFAHASITVAVGASKYFGVTSIDYESELETNPVHGTGANQVGAATGALKHTGNLEMLLQHAAKLRRALGQGYMEVPLVITVTYRETAISELHTDLLDCFIKKDGTSSQQGADPVKVKYELHVNQITRDGLVAVASEE